MYQPLIYVPNNDYTSNLRGFDCYLNEHNQLSKVHISAESVFNGIQIGFVSIGC